MQSNKICPICKKVGHSKYYCKNKPYKPIKRTAIRSKSSKSVSKKNLPAQSVVRKSRTTQKKKPTRSKLTKQLDKLVKDYVKERDNHICQWCGKEVYGASCHGSHVYSVGSCPRLRFEPLNLKVLCAYCHRRRWHSSPVEAFQWFESKFPERLKQLNELKLQNTKITTVEIQELIDEYKEKLTK